MFPLILFVHPSHNPPVNVAGDACSAMLMLKMSGAALAQGMLDVVMLVMLAFGTEEQGMFADIYVTSMHIINALFIQFLKRALFFLPQLCGGQHVLRKR